MSDTVIDAAQLHRVLIQYLQENGLSRSAQCLQDESGVLLDSINDRQQLQSDIVNGRWERVMNSLSYLNVTSDQLHDMFEQIATELIDHSQNADAVIRFIDLAVPLHTDPLFRHRLRAIAESGASQQDEQERATKRKRLAKGILAHLPEGFPSGRLLSLLSEVVSHKAIPGSRFNLLTGESELVAEEKRLSGVDRSIKLSGKASFAESVLFTPDGGLLVVGGSDGLIEVFNARTLALEVEAITYQKSGNFMFHSTAVTALAMNPAGDLLISGDATGTLKIWKFKTGEKVAAVKLHTAAINSLQWRDTVVLTGSNDGAAKLFSAKTLRSVRDFRILDQAMIYDARFVGASLIVTASVDGLLRLWDCTNGEVVRQLLPPMPEGHTSGMTRSVRKVVPDKSDGSLTIFCDNTQVVVRMDGIEGTLISSMSTKEKGKRNMLTFLETQRYLYSVYEDNKVRCFSRETSDLELEFELPGARPSLAVGFNPVTNEGVFATRDGQLHFVD